MPFDQSKANRALNFFEGLLTHTKGSFARKPFLLPWWQRKIVSDVFGTVRKDGLRQYRTVYIEIPKKNGKTELAAGFANKLLFDDDEAGAEVYSCASTRDQAAICHRVAAQMVRQCDLLNDRCRIIDSTKVIYLSGDPNCFYKAISADADIQDGINPSGFVFDEMHRQRTRDLWDVLEYGTDTRRQPLGIVITTAGEIGSSPIYEELHDKAVQILKGTFKDPTFYAVIFALENDEDWTFEGEPGKYDRAGNIIKKATGWYKANPALGDFLQVEAVRRSVDDAKQIPSKQNSLRRFRFNQRTNVAETWIVSDIWKLGGEPFNPSDFVGRTCYGGLDLSSTIDVAAFVLEFPWEGDYYLIPHFFLPEAGIVERCRRDNVIYDIWAKQGLITLTPGDVVDYNFVRKTIKDAAELYNLVDIGHDPWNATQLVTELTETDGLIMTPHRQGYASMSGPSKDWETKVRVGQIRHNNNPILAWMNDCCSIKSDEVGNIKPIKPDRLASSRRIDGIIAGIMAHDRCIRHEAQGKSVYDERGLIVL